MNDTVLNDCKFYYTISLTIDGERYSRIVEAAAAVGVSVEDFVLEAANEECYLTLGEE